MGLQHYTQDMSKIPLKYHKKVLFYTKYRHPLSVGGHMHGRTDARTHGRTDARKIFTQYSGISSCSVGSTNRGVTHQTDEQHLNNMSEYFVGVVNIAFNCFINRFVLRIINHYLLKYL